MVRIFKANEPKAWRASSYIEILAPDKPLKNLFVRLGCLLLNLAAIVGERIGDSPHPCR
jgi:hypothetical protein